MFNYNTLVDTIPSGCFTFIKSHTIYMTESSNVFLSDSLFMFILFLLSSSIMFLMNLRLVFNYNYFRNNLFADLLFVAVLLYVIL